MAPKLKISLAQFRPKPLSPSENFARAATEIEAAAAQGSHLVVLPEYHLTSWVPEDEAFEASCSESAAYLHQYQNLARKHNIHIVPGTFIEVGPASGGAASDSITTNAPGTGSQTELRNVAYFIAAGTGSIIASYQKKNLWHPERGVLTPDLHTPHTTFDISIPGLASASTVRVGLLICWDVAFPESFRELVASGAELVIVPAFWHIAKINPEVHLLNPNSEVAFLDSVVVARAYENTCAVAFCNAFGQSQVAMPILGCLKKIEAEQEGLIECEVDFGVVQFAEDNYKVRMDMGGNNWHYSRSGSHSRK